MDLAEKLFLHSQVSVKEFSELLLEMTPPLQPNFVSNVDIGRSTLTLYTVNSHYSGHPRDIVWCP